MPAALRQALCLALLALLPAVISAFLHPRRPDFWSQPREGEITLNAALRKPGDYLWIDARTVTEHTAGHIPGSLPLNLEDWVNLLPTVLEAWPEGKPVIVYCDSRRCKASEDVAMRLREFDQAPVFVLKGGWEAWRAAQK